MPLKPWKRRQHVGAVAAEINNCTDLEPAKYRMNTRSDISPAIKAALATSKEAPEQKYIIGSYVGVTQVRKGSRYLSERASPSGRPAIDEGKRVKVRVEMTWCIQR